MNRKKPPLIHYFETPSGDRMITISLDLLAELKDLEDLEDEILAARVAWEHAHAGMDDRFWVPSDVVHRLLDGENPIKAWREHRNLSRGALAEAVGVTDFRISEIETGRCRPSQRLLIAIAKALGVPLSYMEEHMLDIDSGDTA